MTTRWIVATACALLLGVVDAAGADVVRRYALVAGANQGGRERPTLRYAVSDAARFADHFGCERILHRDDVTSGTRDVEQQPTGPDVVELGPDLLFVPVPGHTRGSACLLWREKYLFTGDHLAWHRGEGRLHAFRGACWYDWGTQIESMRRLAELRFEWVLPGHGSPGYLPAERMKNAMVDLVAWMETR